MSDRLEKEIIYDELIHPLMKQIIQICKEHKIAALCNFCLGKDENGNLQCTTALLAEDMEPTPALKEAFQILNKKSSYVTSITI